MYVSSDFFVHKCFVKCEHADLYSLTPKHFNRGLELITVEIVEY